MPTSQKSRAVVLAQRRHGLLRLCRFGGARPRGGRGPYQLRPAHRGARAAVVSRHLPAPEDHDKLMVRNEALRAIGGSALTDDAIAVPEADEVGRSVPVTYVPFRNAHFLAVAVSWAEVVGAEKVYIGAVEPDSSGYPDCRPAYYKAFNEVVRTGTKGGSHRNRHSAHCHAQNRYCAPWP